MYKMRTKVELCVHLFPFLFERVFFRTEGILDRFCVRTHLVRYFAAFYCNPIYLKIERKWGITGKLTCMKHVLVLGMPFNLPKIGSGVSFFVRGVRGFLVCKFSQFR